MKSIVYILCLLFILSSCETKKNKAINPIVNNIDTSLNPIDTTVFPAIDTAISSCILAFISTIISQGDKANVTSIRQYYYDEKICYLFVAGCCDMFNSIADNDCNYLCSPSGGISGKGDGKCPDFKQNAYFIRTIWQK